MRTNHKFNWLNSLLLSALMSIQVIAVARELPADLQPLEDIPPPTLGADESTTENAMDEPEITIVKRGEDTVEEYRINGQLYMMKVTPAHGKPYYMHKEDQDGGWLMDGPNPPLVVPKWTILKF